MSLKKIILFQLFLFCFSGVFSIGNVDSLRAVLNSTKSETVKIDTYIELSAASEGEGKRRYLNQALKWARKINDPVRLGDIYEKIGDLFYPFELDSASYYYQLSYDTYQYAFNNKEKVAKALNNMGTIYWYKNKLSEALEYYLKALEINKEIGNTKNYAINCLNIAMLYNQLEEYNKALTYLDKMEAADLSEMDIKFMHAAMNTKGIIFYNLKRYDDAKLIHENNLNRAFRIGESYQIGMSLENLGLVFIDLNQPDSAIYYLERALTYSQYRQDYEFAGLYNNIGEANLKRQDYNESQNSYQKALEFGLKSDYKPWLLATYKGLSDVNKATKNYQQSVYFLEKFLEIKDSLLLEEKLSTLEELEAKYQAKQNAAEIQLLKKNEELGKIALEKKAITIEKQSQKQMFFTIGAIILVLLVIVILFAFLAKKKSNRLLEEQKAEIQAQHILLMGKNNEIIHSLNYAKRLQAAILPTQKSFEKHFDSHFVFYLPKSIVSGDFYWLEENNGKIHLAVADCTGHGVPGALVSVVCSNALTRVLYEDNPQNSAAILDLSRDKIVNYFSRNEANINDGMDIALISFSPDIQNGEYKMEFAGANNPLWIMRDGKFLEWKADKQSLGKVWEKKTYTNHKFTAEKGDTLYLFSDGFQDQFGGEKGKKFKSAQLKELLISIHKKPMEQQKKSIQQALEKWQGSLDQIDDICVIGVRI